MAKTTWKRSVIHPTVSKEEWLVSIDHFDLKLKLTDTEFQNRYIRPAIKAAAEEGDETGESPIEVMNRWLKEAGEKQYAK